MQVRRSTAALLAWIAVAALGGLAPATARSAPVRAIGARAEPPAYTARAEPAPYPSPRAITRQGEPLARRDRWRLVEELGVRENLLNPYEQNTLKGDRPIYGREWFLALGLESRTEYEFGRRLGPGRESDGLEARRDGYGTQSVVGSVSLRKGSTVFRPPDWQLRASAALLYQGGVSPGVQPLRGGGGGGGGDARRSERRFALRELFVERHLRTKSDRYDFDSLRVGVQPFTSDFRGWLYHGSNPGARLFGNFAGNRFQYNAAWFRRLAEDPVFRASALRLHRDDVWALNVYLHDFPGPGFSLEGGLFYERDRSRRTGEAQRSPLARAGAPGRAGTELPRSRKRDALYLGLSGNGHLDRLNLSFAAYAARGRDGSDALTGSSQQVRAGFAAVEASADFDWVRVKLYGLWASGDEDPGDGRAEGFLPIRENGRLGGFEEGYFGREGVPLGRGAPVLGRDGLLATLRSRGEGAATSFVQPGLRVLGVGANLDILPELRLSWSAATVSLDEAAVLSELLGGEREVPEHIGTDLATILHYRPLFTNNVVLHVAFGALRPGAGLRALARRESSWLYSCRASLQLRY